MSMNISAVKVLEALKEPVNAATLAKALSRADLSRDQIWALPKPAGYKLFEQITREGETVYVLKDCSAQLPGVGVKERSWAYWISEKDPYVWVQFPNDSSVKRKIVPLSDVHYGARECNYKKLAELVDWIEKTPEVYVLLPGDLIENALAESVGGAVFEQIITPEEQLWGTKDGRYKGIIEVLRKIAHRILGAVEGNHEERSTRVTTLSPMKIICRELGVPYVGEPIFMDILSWGHKFTTYLWHGHTYSNSPGGKILAASKPSEFQEEVNLLLSGHVHTSSRAGISKIQRKRVFGKDGKLKSFQLVEKSQTVLVAPALLKFFGSYAARMSLSPGSFSAVAFVIFKDGTHRASE